MKLTIILITIACVQVSARAIAQQININAKNTSLSKVLQIIQQQSGQSIFFDNRQVQKAQVSNVSISNASLQDALAIVLKDQPFAYTIIDNTVVITSKVNAVQSAAPIRISGTVTDERGILLPGVSVMIKGTTNGTVTDHKGSYSISVQSGQTLVFSFLGYKKTEIIADGKRTINVSLTPDAAQLNDVVVTALGIKREEKSLGFAAQTLKDKAVEDAKTNNWVNSLTGKVAGLNIQGTGSGPISSSRITLRGENSLNLDNNQALIVLDGVPVNSKITGTGFKAHLATDSPIDFGSDVSDINPDDIESITVLKGPGATALYGSRAAGGALIITTKSGARKDAGLGITYNLNMSIDQVNRWPDYQYEYGEGRTTAYYSYGDSADGINTSTNAAAGRAWGPKFNGQSYFQYDPNTPNNKATERTPWKAYPDYIKGFFQTGSTVTNNLSIEGGNDKSSARLSLSHLGNKWIIPNTGFSRTSVALSVNHKINDKLRISGKANYTNKESDNLPSAGYNNQTLMYFLAIGTAPNIDHNWFKPYWQPGLVGVQQKNPFNPGPDNPYIDLYEDLNKLSKNGFIGTASAFYQFSNKLELMLRTSLDMSSEFRSQQRPYSITKYPKGSYREENVYSFESNNDLLLTYKDKVNQDIKFSLNAGANALVQNYNFAGIYADQLAQPGVYQLSNSLDPAVADPQRTKKAVNSIYAATQWSYKDAIFLDLTGRNDWSSTLPYKHNSFFYPSVSTSFSLGDMFTLPHQISFAKLRLSYAQVGNDTRPYQTSKYYDKIYSNSFTTATTLYNPTLKPEITSSYEAGLDLRLFNSRLSTDIAVYRNNSRNQILAIPLDPTSGNASALVNAGLIESNGVEVQLRGTPILKNNFRWNTTLNWSRNRSYVRELTNGLTSQVIYSHDGNVTIEARVGGRMGDLYGLGYQRSPEGKIIYNSTGLPAPLDPVAKKLGNAFADWKSGLINEFLIKKVRFSFQLDYQHGGKMFSQTNHKNNTLGKTKVTLPGRDGGIVGDGVVRGADGVYRQNTVSVSASSYYENYYAINNAENNIFDTSFLKLREARVEFNLTLPFLTKAGFKQTSVAVYGRDLFDITKFPGFDPEGGNLNSGTLTPGVELMQFPSPRTIGLNLTFKL
ncbi:SusC/RagA family TonB-linked outer membrane protein [Mucilaginibacter sp. RS28]|uniref:SusC/RagA family TonB-linked outer membrane protein n=1 Tax=Mucilaginibacter straminoryzae TaxID=2932774 RepID=A0A9X1X5A1_9SPHI|nr:SusC/RagA family TonB-linked outer membrane protein [Mucilaginibacter straminoryzae]MCJ8211332.1 SusC/RagA family TonB-linked outer membrane protein [Mucilaginibacter straminoryzae]